MSTSVPLLLHELSLSPALRVTVMAPHPDDFDAIAVTLRHLNHNGNRIDLLVLSPGDSGVDDHYAATHAPLTKAELRRHEQLASCRCFGLPEDRVRFLQLATDSNGTMEPDGSNLQCLSTAILASPPDVVFLPHGHDTNADHRHTYAMFRLLVHREKLSLVACLNRDPKTITMQVDLATPFAEGTADWKRTLLRCHDSQQQRNLRTRGIGFDERILNSNALAAQEADLAAPFAEVFELETFETGTLAPPTAPFASTVTPTRERKH